MEKVPPELKQSVVRTIRKCGGIVRGWLACPDCALAEQTPPHWVRALPDGWPPGWMGLNERDEGVGFVFFESGRTKWGPSGWVYAALPRRMRADQFFTLLKGRSGVWGPNYEHDGPDGAVVVAEEPGRIYMRFLVPDEVVLRGTEPASLDAQRIATLAARVPRFLCLRTNCFAGALERNDETAVRVLTEVAGHTLWRI